jgi:hypothetical protein
MLSNTATSTGPKINTKSETLGEAKRKRAPAKQQNTKVLVARPMK